MFESLNISSVERLRSGTYWFNFHGCHCILDVSAFGSIWFVKICRFHTSP